MDWKGERERVRRGKKESEKDREEERERERWRTRTRNTIIPKHFLKHASFFRTRITKASARMAGMNE